MNTQNQVMRSVIYKMLGSLHCDPRSLARMLFK